MATTPELLAAWGDIPALRGIEAQVFDAFDAQYPGVNWRVAVDGIEFACIPHHDNLTMPGFAEAFDRFLKLPGLVTMQGNLDLDGELDRLEADLQAIFTAAAK